MKISDVSEQTGLTPHTLRYYEKIGLIETGKNENGHRDYSEENVDLLNWVACLKHSGMSLNRIREYVSASQQKDSQLMTEILSEHLKRLEQQKKQVEHYLIVTKTKIKRLTSN